MGGGGRRTGIAAGGRRRGAARRGARLRDALRVLPGEQARVLELSCLGDLSHAEIGRRLGVPLGTVKGRLRLALARLRVALEGDEP